MTDGERNELAVAIVAQYPEEGDFESVLLWIKIRLDTHCIASVEAYGDFVNWCRGYGIATPRLTS